MIKSEYVTINGVNLLRTYSDTDMKIHKIGTSEVYDEAIDVVGNLFTYEETAEPREIPSATESEMREALTILGVVVP